MIRSKCITLCNPGKGIYPCSVELILFKYCQSWYWYMYFSHDVNLSPMWKQYYFFFIDLFLNPIQFLFINLLMILGFLIFLQWNPNPELKVSCSASLQSQPSCTILWELCVKLKPWLETITFLKFILNWIYPKYLPQRNNYFFLLTINIIEFSITYNDNLIKRSTEVNLLRIVSKATLWQNQFWWIKIKF